MRLSLRDQSWRGAAWKALAGLCFSAINGIVKSLIGHFPFAEVAFFEHLFAMVWLLPFVFLDMRQCLFLEKPLWHLWRVLVSALGVMLWYQALHYLPMAHAVALGFLGPMATSLGAVFILKEPFTSTRFVAIALGLVGGMLISHSFQSLSFSSCGWAVFLPVGSALAFSCSTLLNKRLTSFDAPLAIVTSLIVLMTPFFGALSLPVWVTPSWADLGIFFVLGGLTALAHMAITRSLVCSDVLFLLPIGSLRFVFTALIGFFFFAQHLDFFIFLGFFSIVTGLTLLSFFEKRAHKMN